jgi:curved DNA-binding protein CbpA
MRDPFEVLGLAPGASDDQVRVAYRELARRYSDAGSMPDPARMSEIDAAYDEIILKRTGNGGNSYSEPTYTYSVPNDFGDIRAKIKSGKIDDAETLLDGVPVPNRTAEWYYLKGTVQHRRGWLEEAARNFEQATRLDPSNAEYNRAYNSINSDRSGGYRTERSKGGDSGCSACDMCQALLCADCCCECVGCDLIRCC